MLEKEYSTVINRPVHEVFEYVTDPAKIPGWASYIEKVRVNPPGPLGVGSEIIQTVRGREAVWQVTAYEPDVFCKYEADYWYATANVTYRVERVENGTRFSIHDKGYRKGFMRLVEPILNRIDIYYRKRQMEIIKEALEKGRIGAA